MRQRIKIWALAVLLCWLLGGCGESGQQPPAAGQREYLIYDLNTAGTKLLSRAYQTAAGGEALVRELLACLSTVPEDLDAQPAIPDVTAVSAFEVEDVVLYLTFDGGYAGLESGREILCRAALARTLTQVPGIEYISIYIGDQPLLEKSGQPVGIISAADFVDSISDVNAYERENLLLYFTDASGTLLYPERRSVMHSVNTPVERVVLEELISGPESAKLWPTLESGLEILNVSTADGICYVNFGSSFVNNPLGVEASIPVYSVVNSLSELPTVTRVQISVNGSQDVTLRDGISLNTVFERNLDYIGGDQN